MIVSKTEKVRCTYKGYVAGFISYDKMLQMMEYVLRQTHTPKPYHVYVRENDEIVESASRKLYKENGKRLAKSRSEASRISA